MYIYICIYIYREREMHTFIYVSRPRGDRKFGGCFCFGLLGRQFR